MFLHDLFISSLNRTTELTPLIEQSAISIGDTFSVFNILHLTALVLLSNAYELVLVLM